MSIDWLKKLKSSTNCLKSVTNLAWENIKAMQSKLLAIETILIKKKQDVLCADVWIMWLSSKFSVLLLLWVLI